MSLAGDQQHPRLQRLVVTRPAGEAERWVQALRANHWPALALPLIEIAEPRSPAAQQGLVQARSDWSQWDALMFVSSAAVDHFFSAGAVLGRDRASTRFWAPGPGTGAALARALQRLGVSPDRIDTPPADASQFDSEALWPVVRAQLALGRRVLVVRGETQGPAARPATDALAGQGRDWLIRQCERLGARVEACVAYERRPPLWTDRMRAVAGSAVEPGSAWLLSSSEALLNLQAGVPGADWSQAAALATHDRIASAARSAGFGAVHSSRPALPDVLRALELHWSHP